MPSLKVSRELALPENAVTSTLLVYGGKGTGKSNFGTVLLEEMTRARYRWSALDPMGVLWGIRHSIDGKGPGIECLILGGPHGDLPIEPTAGAVVADLVVDNDMNVVIDISRKPNGEMWGVGERIRFVTEYGRRLFARQGSLVDGKRREPLFQLIDEAARFMPQMIRQGESDVAKCMSVWATIVEEGRNIGLGVGLLTQRSARLSKDVAELADMMLAFRTVGPNSLSAVLDWLGEHVSKERIKTMVETVRSLPVGSCLAVSPGWLKHEGVIHIRARETFDSSATPKPGERGRKVSGNGAKPVDLEKYAVRMKETIERVESDNPAALRSQIANLKAEVRSLVGSLDRAKATPPMMVPDPKQIEAIVKREVQEIVDQMRVKAGQLMIDRMKGCAEELIALSDRFTRFAEVIADPKGWTLQALTADGAKAIKDVRLVPAPAIPAAPHRPHATAAPPPPPNHVPAPPSALKANSGPSKAIQTGSTASLGGPEMRILNAIAWFEAIGLSAPEQVAVSFLAGYSVTSSSYGVPKSKLKSAELVEYIPGGKISLTEAGRRLATPPNIPRTNEAVQNAVMERLGGPERRVLAPLLTAYPKAMTANDVAYMAGYSPTSSSFGVPKSRLKSFGLIEYPQPGKLRAAEALFPIR